MITIEELIGDISHIDAAKLTYISDKLWEIGNLENIKEKTSPDLFYSMSV